VNKLRQEKESAEQAAAALKADNERLAEEVETLRAERKQVRGRIEKLLGQLDTLTS
jgi:FtsZ-binding cell division protein ZapB